MIKQLFASDMDGTFLTSQHTYDKERFERLLESLAAKDGLFVAASGRQLLNLEDLFSDYRDRMAFVAENGAVVVYQDQVIFEQFLTIEQIEALIEALRTYTADDKDVFLLSGKRSAYVFDTVDPDYLAIAKDYYHHIQVIQSLVDIQDDEIFKLTAAFDEIRVFEVQDLLAQKFDDVQAVVTGFAAIDVMPITINKSVGLRALLAHLDLRPDALYSFGDNFNDLEMLEMTPHSFATRNARPEVKQVANQVIGSCDEGAVLACIEKMIDL